VATGVAANGGREIAFGPASEDAWKVLNRVDSKGAPLPGYKGGSTFLNDGSQGAQVLPRTASDGSSITYREWDLSAKIKGVPRDASRLVTGSDGSAFYTTDHYLSFIQFR
jgi:guanyl-specific ribonuclease Sa